VTYCLAAGSNDKLIVSVLICIARYVVEVGLTQKVMIIFIHRNIMGSSSEINNKQQKYWTATAFDEIGMDVRQLLERGSALFGQIQGITADPRCGLMWIIRIIVLDLLQRPGRCSKSKACGSTGAF